MHLPRNDTEKAEELATEFHGKKTLHSIWVDE